MQSKNLPSNMNNINEDKKLNKKMQTTNSSSTHNHNESVVHNGNSYDNNDPHAKRKSNNVNDTEIGNANGSEDNHENKNSQDANSLKKRQPRYQADRVIGSGSFGIVYRAVSLEKRSVVAIKKVREDRRYKNRELQIMKIVKHPNVVTLVDCFYSKINRDIYLNLVMEYIPESLYFTIRNHAKAGQTIPYDLIKLYAYQLCRAISYCHQRKICHRDIKPQNLLFNPDTHCVKLCDFGSAKRLKEGEPNVSYICSRYYRAPELIFESQFYETAIDLWSLGCVIGELFLGTPLFQGEKSVDQLVEIIKVLGTPTPEDIKAMNSDYQQTKFPIVKPLPWKVVFASVSYEHEPVPAAALDLISKFLVFAPKKRIDSFEALFHPFFDDLRNEETTLPDGGPLPPLFNFTHDELRYAESKGIDKRKLIPSWYSNNENEEEIAVQENFDAENNDYDE